MNAAPGCPPGIRGQFGSHPIGVAEYAGGEEVDRSTSFDEKPDDRSVAHLRGRFDGGLVPARSSADQLWMLVDQLTDAVQISVSVTDTFVDNRLGKFPSQSVLVVAGLVGSAGDVLVPDLGAGRIRGLGGVRGFGSPRGLRRVRG